jgi:hypothetical protein
VNEKLSDLYEKARGGKSIQYQYIEYCNTRITGTVSGECIISLSQYRRDATRDFDVRNIPVNVFQDRVAEWIVTGEVDCSGSAVDPLEW